MGEGQDRRGGALPLEPVTRARVEPSASEDSLLGARRRCHQGRNRRLEKEEGSQRARGKRDRRQLAAGTCFAFGLCKQIKQAKPEFREILDRIRRLRCFLETATIHVTEKAATKIQELLAKEGVPPETGGLRVGVQGGGCSGLTYAMRLDTPAGDRAQDIEKHGWGFVCGPQELPLPPRNHA